MQAGPLLRHENICPTGAIFESRDFEPPKSIFIGPWPTQARFWLEWGYFSLLKLCHRPDGSSQRECRNSERGLNFYPVSSLAGGPLKPVFGLSGDVHMSQT